MFTLKHVVVFIILQNSVSSFYHHLSELSTEDYDDCLYIECEKSFTYSDKTTEFDELENVSKQPENIENIEQKCPEDHSLISKNDIKYLIEHKVETLKIKEKIVNNYYPDTEEIIKKYVDELEEFQKKFEDRPEHILHILNDMAVLHQKLKPDVEEIAAKLEEYYTLEFNYSELAKRAGNLLNQLEKYKNLCEINCEDYHIDNRFGVKTISNTLSAKQYCIRLKDLNDRINDELNEVQAQNDEDLDHLLENRDNKIAEFKKKIKEAAVKEFGMTMYDILSLQDDYHHFCKDFNHDNISLEINNILDNTAEIEFRLIAMKRNLEKFRHYCRNCITYSRIKRNNFDSMHDSDVVELSDISIETIDDNRNIVDEFLNAIINEIKVIIKNNITAMFEELDEKLNNPDIIDLYVSKLHPIQNEIGNEIKTQQEALNELRNNIPQASIDNIHALSKKSKEMIQMLEYAKQFIEQYISDM